MMSGFFLSWNCLFTSHSAEFHPLWKWQYWHQAPSLFSSSPCRLEFCCHWHCWEDITLGTQVEGAKSHFHWETQLDPLRKSLLKTTHHGCWFWEQRGHSCLVQGHSSHQALLPSHLASACVSCSLNLEMCLIPVQQGDWLFMWTYVAVVCVRLTLQFFVEDDHCWCWKSIFASCSVTLYVL
jgi:hypothetical protein